MSLTVSSNLMARIVKVSIVLLLLSFTFINGTKFQQSCPEHFFALGKKCYFFSNTSTSWDNAHFDCLSRNSSLAVIKKSSQAKILRNFMNNYLNDKFERWIGGKYNWKKSRWVWGTSGVDIDYQAFSRMNSLNSKQWEWHCIITDPAKHNKWSARNCLKKKHYICFVDNSARTVNKAKFDTSICTREDTVLTVSEKRRCVKLLGFYGKSKNEPGFLVQRETPSKKIFYVCPKQTVLIGDRCYYFSKNASTFHDANFECMDRQWKLAEIKTKRQNFKLREFLAGFIGGEERWIGGLYDWKTKVWRWAYSGKPLKFKGFVRNMQEKDLSFHGLTMDPQLKYRWNSRLRSEKLPFICEVKPKTVLENRNLRFSSPSATVHIQTIA